MNLLPLIRVFCQMRNEVAHRKDVIQNIILVQNGHTMQSQSSRFVKNCLKRCRNAKLAELVNTRLVDQLDNMLVHEFHADIGALLAVENRLPLTKIKVKLAIRKLRQQSHKYIAAVNEAENPLREEKEQKGEKKKKNGKQVKKMKTRMICNQLSFAYPRDCFPSLERI